MKKFITIGMEQAKMDEFNKALNAMKHSKTSLVNRWIDVYIKGGYKLGKIGSKIEK